MDQKRGELQSSVFLNITADHFTGGGSLIDSGDEELKKWSNDRENLMKDIEGWKNIISDIDAATEEESGTPITSLQLIAKKLKDLDDKVANLTQTVDFRSKTKCVEGILNRAESLAREAIRAELLDSTNERLEFVLANDPLRLERIDQSLHLANQSGASAGQKLSVGYTFLMSALSRGKNDFPLIVNSPAGPIDEGVRRNIGQLIPQLCTQFVGFTINTERPGFVPALERASDDCLFLTLFRRTEGTRRLEQNLPADGVVQTTHATLVNDRDYFMSFDVADEGEL